jgi:hypothetical protein
MTVDNGSGLGVRTDINSALQALASLSSGASAPSPSFPCQLWADTGTSRLKRRNAANSAWVDEGPLDAALRDAASQGGFVADTGAANAYVCNFVPALTARSESTPLRFKVANANSTASTINDGVGTVALVGSTHAALIGGELVVNGIAWIQWNASAGAYVLLFCTGAAGPAVNQVQTAFTTAGTAPAFTLTPAPALGGYAANQRFRVKFNAAAATSGTLNVSGLGAKNLKQYDSAGAKVAAVIASGQLADIEYDGTDMVVLDPLPGASKQIPPVLATVAANALTVTINPNSFDFRSTTLSSGLVNGRVLSSAVSLVVPSGATLGTLSGVAARLALLALDNAGTVEPAIVNLAGGNNLDETTLVSTTAISAGATAANVIYSTTARTSVPFRVVGLADLTQATAGTWATGPSLTQGAGGQALAAMASFGYGQTVQNVTGSRALVTTFYNTTGKAILVSVTGTAAVGANINITVSGVVVALSSPNAPTNSCVPWVCAIVPPGAPYSVNGTSISVWAEFR